MAADNLTKNDDDLFVEQISMQSNPRIANFVRDYIAAIRQEAKAAPDILAELHKAVTLADDAADAFRRAGMPDQSDNTAELGNGFREAIAKVITP